MANIDEMAVPAIKQSNSTTAAVVRRNNRRCGDNTILVAIHMLFRRVQNPAAIVAPTMVARKALDCQRAFAVFLSGDLRRNRNGITPATSNVRIGFWAKAPQAVMAEIRSQHYI
jgi:hypothetical protein